MYRKLKLFLLFIGLCFSIFGQVKISKIEFKSLNVYTLPQIETLIRIESNEIETKILVQQNSIMPDSINSLNKTLLIDTIYITKTQNFEKLTSSVIAITSTNLLSNLSYEGLQGCQTQIEYGNDFNSIIYKVWSPDKDTKARELDTYVALCKQITKLGKLNYKDIISPKL